MAGELKLTYWDGKGRAEPIRIALRAAGVAFTDERIKDKATWPELKKTLGSAVPVLTIDGRNYSQSIALARYAAKLSDPPLYPTDPLAALAVDEVMDITQDIMTSTPQNPDEAERKRLRAEYASGKLKMFVDLLAARLEVNGGEFMAGPKPTIADAVLYSFVLELVRNGMFTDIPTDYVDAWPKISEYEKRVAAWIDTVPK